MTLLRSIGLSAILICLPLSALAAECNENSARPDVGKPLQAAANAVKSKNIKDANAALKTAEAVKDRCPYENFIIEQMRAAVATASGDHAQAIRSYEAMLASGRLPQAEQVRTMEALAALNYQSKDYGKAISWTNKYLQAGGSSPRMSA